MIVKKINRTAILFNRFRSIYTPISSYLRDSNSAVMIKIIAVTVIHMAMSLKDNGIVTGFPRYFGSERLVGNLLAGI